MRWPEDPLGVIAATSPRASFERVSIATLLHDARTRVKNDSRSGHVSIIVVAVHEEVFVPRAMVVSMLAELVLDSVAAVAPAGRVAITGQAMEGDLVFAVYDSGKPRAMSARLHRLCVEATARFEGRVWSPVLDDGNLALMSMPLGIGAN